MARQSSKRIARFNIPQTVLDAFGPPEYRLVHGALVQWQGCFTIWMAN
jgi:hypothetical protein